MIGSLLKTAFVLAFVLVSSGGCDSGVLRSLLGELGEDRSVDSGRCTCSR